MASRFRGCCGDCGHAWDGLWWTACCGPVAFAAPDSYRGYYCPRCLVDLYVPRILSRAVWLRWIGQNATETTRGPLSMSASEHGVHVDARALEVIARSPLLFAAAERVSRLLSGSRSRWQPVAIDLGRIECPHCGDPLHDGDWTVALLDCPAYGQRAASALPEPTPCLPADYTPIPVDDVRRIVAHLTELAEPAITTRRLPGI